MSKNDLFFFETTTKQFIVNKENKKNVYFVHISASVIYDVILHT